VTRHVGPAANYLLRSQLAGAWQSIQLRNGHIPGYAPHHPDWGLTIDTAFMLAANGQQGDRLQQVEQAVAKHILDYAVYKGSTSSGAMSKVLLVSEVLKADPESFGGIDVRKKELKLVAPPSAGFEAGRLRDTGKHDYSNTFGQAYGTVGLARSGGVPQDVVDYLLKQRCSAGFFRLDEMAGQTCDDSGSSPDVDATALGLEALIAAKANGAAVSHAAIAGTAAWLVSVQNADGSFAEDASGPANADSNTTGLAAVALDAAGRTSARLKAASWVAGLQLTKANTGQGPARPDIGSIAFDPDALADALANGLGANRPQWWRSTPQAYFALHPVPLGTLTAP
jgi:hypothetical protein